MQLKIANRKSKIHNLAFLFLILVYVLPIWVFKYFPSQDGPCHIYNSFILRHYNDPEYVFNQFYDVRKAPIPNWASHASMMLLMYLVPPLIAEKLLLTGYIVLMAVAMRYLVNAVEGDRTPLVFLGFPFIYNYLFLMGFYNFSLGVALFMLSVGYWWRHFNIFDVKRAAVLGSLLVVVYFCHPVPLVLAVLSIVPVGILMRSVVPNETASKSPRPPLQGGETGFAHGSRLPKMISSETTIPMSLPPRFARWKQALVSSLCTLPSLGLLLYYVQTRGTERSPGSWTLAQLWEYFIRNESLAYHSESQIVFGWLVTGAFAILFLYTLIRDHFFTKEWRFGLRVRRRDFLLLLCIAFFVIYLRAPDGMSGGGFIKTRMALFPFLIVIPWLSWDMPRIGRGVVGGALALLSVAYITQVSYYHKIMNDDIKVYVSGYDAVERNKVILPLGFDYMGKSWRIGIFTHTPGYYGYETGCINLINYEASTDYFPTVFKPDFHRPPLEMVHVKQTEIDFAEYKDDIDYVLTWALEPGSDVESRILEYYSLIKHNGNLKIFRRISTEK
jgi:hypothetical protein